MTSLTDVAVNPVSLYLMFSDGTQLFLTPDHITRITERYWQDPAKIPDQVKAAIDFQRCAGCPMNSDMKICDALRPILPLLEHVDKFASFEPVQVVYTGTNPGTFHIANTTLQTALSYVSVLSLINYCQAGREFRKYYYDIIPLISPTALAGRLYLNIYWLHQGVRQEISQVIANFSHGIKMISENLVRRLNLISHNDAFNNAFVNTYVATSLLMLGIEKELEKSFKHFEQST